MRSRDKSGQRGQSIVLMAVTALLLAFTLMTTVSIGKAIHERVALQQAADAAAYSLSVEEARAFNYLAYSNRALVAHDVTMMAILGHISYDLAWKDTLSSAMAMVCMGDSTQTAIEEDAICLTGPHACALVHACVAALKASRFVGLCTRLQAEAKAVDLTIGTFLAEQSAIVGAQAGSMNGLAVGQAAVDGLIYNILTNPAALTQPIARAFSPNFTSENMRLPNIVGLLAQGVGMSGGEKTAPAYCNVVDSPVCQGGTVHDTQPSAANGARYAPSLNGGMQAPVPGGAAGSTTPDWLLNRQYGVFQNRLNLILTESGVTQVGFLVGGHGASQIVGSPSGDPTSEIQSPSGGGNTRVAAEDHLSIVLSDTNCIQVGISAVGEQDIKTWAATGPSGGVGQIQTVRNGVQTVIPVPGLGMGSPGLPKAVSASVNFLMPASPAQSNFNQPRTFAMMSEKFTKDSWGPGAFALDNGIHLVDGSSYTYDNVPTGPANRQAMVAIAQGMTYYHRPGLWKEPPNFYNPYWRAKLHPFDNNDQKLELIMYSPYASTVTASTSFNPSELTQ